MKENFSYLGKILCCPTKGELNSLYEKIKNEISCKVLLINKRTNVPANIKNLLNILDLQLQEQDEVEFILFADTKEEVSANKEKIKVLFNQFIAFK